MSPRLRALLAQLGSFVLAGVLLYLALHNVDFQEVGRALRTADYRWLPALVGVVLLSHLLRAWRWKLLLEALPADVPRRISLRAAFYSVMIGYMVNYVAPRLGEVARSANLSAREHLRFSSVLGTVVVERILDVAVLLVAILSVGVLFWDRLALLHALFAAPMLDQIGWLPALALAGLVLIITILVLFFCRWLLRREASALRRFWRGRMQPVVVSFREGMGTLLRVRHPLAVVVSTIAMWGCYLLMAHLPLVMLGLTQSYQLSLLDGWSLMIFGSLGVVVPSPGGTGSYHWITIQVMDHLFGVARTAAATYAVVTHAAQLVLYTLTGFICLLLQGSSLRSLKATTEAAQQQEPVDAAAALPDASSALHPQEKSP